MLQSLFSRNFLNDSFLLLYPLGTPKLKRVRIVTWLSLSRHVRPPSPNSLLSVNTFEHLNIFRVITIIIIIFSLVNWEEPGSRLFTSGVARKKSKTTEIHVSSKTKLNLWRNSYPEIGANLVFSRGFFFFFGSWNSGKRPKTTNEREKKLVSLLHDKIRLIHPRKITRGEGSLV